MNEWKLQAILEEPSLLFRLLEPFVERLGKASLQGWEVDVRVGSSRKVEVKAGELDTMSLADSSTLGLRLIREGRAGLARTRDLSAEGLELLLEQALSNALLTESEPLLPLRKGIEPQIVVEERVGLGAPGLDELLRWLLRVEQVVREEKGIRNVPHCMMSHFIGVQGLLSHDGVRALHADAAGMTFVDALASDGEDVVEGSMDARWDSCQEVDAKEFARQVIGEVEKNRGRRFLPAGSYPLVLESLAANELFGALSSAFSARAVQEGRSPLRDRLGEEIAPSWLTLVDDGLHPLALDRAPFDAEGAPRQQTPLIEGGRLVSWLHNRHTAYKMQASTTANAHRTPGGPLEVRPHVWATESDQATPIPAGEKHVLLRDLAGLHAGLNPRSGDFSLQASGALCSAKELLPLKPFVFSGNLIDLFQRLRGTGKVPHSRRYCAFQLPDWHLEAMSLSG